MDRLRTVERCRERSCCMRREESGKRGHPERCAMQRDSVVGLRSVDKVAHARHGGGAFCPAVLTLGLSNSVSDGRGGD